LVVVPRKQRSKDKVITDRKSLAMILAGLKASGKTVILTDYVTEFEEATADELLRQLKPTMYAKGADYTLKTLPEKDTIKELDIKAVFVGDKKSHSTTKLIQQIQKLKKK